ncbi:hypothetical protein ABVK25_009421 [Lepraria finkii]|uniref:Fungal-type protein kinase domain-containing protein n=1 Tax=Lepraria finkii TaxID=1340010 RepID=A0ABR4AYU4_9LECA
MAELSQDELEAIRSHPLEKGLNHFRTTFKTRYPKSESANLTEIVDRLISEAPDGGARDIILDLILALQSQPAARVIPSQIRTGPLSGDIATFYGRLSSNQEHSKYVAPLLKLVLNEAKDTDIWAAVLDLVVRTRPTPQPTTPPPSHPSFTSSFPQTPWSFNTGGFEDTSEYRKYIDNPLREELLPSLRIDIPDFVDAVFGCVLQLEQLTETIFRLCQEGDTPLYNKGSGWSKWPSKAKEGDVLNWLQELMNRLTVWVREYSTRATDFRQIYRGPGIYLDGTPIKRKMDVGFTAGNGQSRADSNTNENTSTRKPNWSEILVTGELKSNPDQDRYEKAWVDLATYAREVFRTQDRRFVLGFTICGSRIRLWHFDRSGACGSSSFDINQDGLAFTRAMLGYYLMTDEQLGLDPTVQGPEGKRYIEITRDSQVERLILTKSIKKQAAIVARGTTCWRAYRDTDKTKKPLIVKDSWQYEERPEEGLLIEEATNRGVENIARYYHHETVRVHGEIDDTLGNIRRGMMEACGRTSFRQNAPKKPGPTASDSQGAAVTGQMQPPPLLRKRSSSSAQLELQSSAKRSRSNFQSQEPEKPLHNRIHRRVVTQDPGKHIDDASSLKGIINGFLGAIHGHESLLKFGALHRDISIGNIMLTENEDDGFLIDFDLSIKTSDDHASGAPSKTGTKVFMAIGALRGEPHSFMHDLESFFWVLFWICIHYEGRDKEGKVKRRKVPQYEKWNYASTMELSDLKTALVFEEERFNEAVAGFTLYCESLIPCIQELWKYVFPNGRRWLGENKKLYSQIQGVLDKARGELKL